MSCVRCVRGVVWDELCVRWVAWDMCEVSCAMLCEMIWVRWSVWDESCETCVRWVEWDGRREMSCVWDEFVWCGATEGGGQRQRDAEVKTKPPHSNVGNKSSRNDVGNNMFCTWCLLWVWHSYGGAPPGPLDNFLVRCVAHSLLLPVFASSDMFWRQSVARLKNYPSCHLKKGCPLYLIESFHLIQPRLISSDLP